MDLTIDWVETVIRLLLAAGLGGLIGLERELDGQDAGFRTHLLLSLGAAVFGLISVGAFDDFTARRAETNVAIDITRIASYVAAGVGFIGGGAIIKHAGVVKGITTAASLWVAAAVGLASGLGHWQSATVAAAVALVALALLQPVSRVLSRRQRTQEASLWIETTSGADLREIIGAIKDHGVALRTIEFGLDPSSAGGQELRIETWSSGAQPDDDLLAEIAARADVSLVTTRRSGEPD